MSEMTYQDVLAILGMIDSGSFSSLELEFGGTRLKVVRSAAGAIAAPVALAVASPAPPPARSPMSASAPGPLALSVIPEVAGGIAVKAPMEGTFYACSAPGAPPFVEIGREVKMGDQLGIVEVMKLFTAINAPCHGTIHAIAVCNEQRVERDQTLLVLVPATVQGEVAP